MNISTKTLVLCLCIAFTTTLSVFLIAENRTKKTLTAEIKKGLKERASNVLISIDRFIYERQHDVVDAARMPELMACRENVDTSYCQKLIENFQQQHQVYETFSYFNTNRIRLADSKRKALFQQHGFRTYWKDLLEKGSTFDISISESLQRPVMHFGESVRDENGEIKGYVVARVGINYLYEVFEEAANHSTRNHISIDLINKDGVVLFSNDSTKTIMVDTLSILNQIKGKTKSGSLLIEDDDQLIYVMHEKGYHDYKGSEWLVVFSVEKERLFAPLGKLHDQLLLLFGITVIVIAILTYLFAFTITKPLKRLTHIINAYRSGDEKQRARIPKNADEAQALAISFNEMADEINSRIDQQKKTNEILKFKIEEITKQRDLINDQNKLIRSSIRYAKNIQNSILPSTNLLHTAHYDIKVFYRPLDVVGGDFYFVEQYRNDDGTVSYYIAVIDCTGHGVPGAFMTIIAQNLLSNAIKKYHRYEVGGILTHLNAELKSFLKQNSSEALVNDGFDIGLIRYSPTTKMLEFTGAYRSLFFYNSAGQIEAIKGDRESIGGSGLKSKPTIFDSHCLEVSVGDEFFMFTDGITDQFDDENTQKYSSKRLKRKLSEMKQSDFGNKVKSCADDLFEWKGKNVQTDDMLFLALKIKNTEEGVVRQSFTKGLQLSQ